jgi:hypothetical protein
MNKMEDPEPSTRIIQPDDFTRHHLHPRSRLQDPLVSPPGNIRDFRHRYHYAWHQLFQNMVPIEALACVAAMWAPPGLFRRIELEVNWDGHSMEYEHVYGRHKEPTRIHTAFFDSLQRRYRFWLALFQNKPWTLILLDIITCWAPVDYFSHIHIIAVDQGQPLILHQTNAAPIWLAA